MENKTLLDHPEVRASPDQPSAVGILNHAMQSVAVHGFITHDHESGAYALTDSKYAALAETLHDARLK